MLLAVFVLVSVHQFQANQQSDEEETDKEMGTNDKPAMETDDAEEDYDEDEVDLDGWW